MTSFGKQLNTFRAKTDTHSDHWNGLVLCKNYDQLKLAMEDAQHFLGGRISRLSHTLTHHSGARLNFRVVLSRGDAERLSGYAVQQVIWLHRPKDETITGKIRSLLRASHDDVKPAELRHEYVCL